MWKAHNIVCFLCWIACLDWELLPYAGCHGGRWLIGDTHLPSLFYSSKCCPVIAMSSSSCFLRVPALEDVESHWLHLSTLSDWRQPAATFQYGPTATLCVIGGQKLLSQADSKPHPGVNICTILICCLHFLLATPDIRKLPGQ